jgi:hypothetical protein
VPLKQHSIQSCDNSYYCDAVLLVWDMQVRSVKRKRQRGPENRTQGLEPSTVSDSFEIGPYAQCTRTEKPPRQDQVQAVYQSIMSSQHRRIEKFRRLQVLGKAKDIGSRQELGWTAHHTLSTAWATYQSTIHKIESTALGVAAPNTAVV